LPQAPEGSRINARPAPGTKSAAAFTIALNNPDLGPTEIAKIVDCDKSLVTHTLQQYGFNKEVTENFKKYRADILASKQEEIIKSLSTDVINNASLMQRSASFGILYDKERLERNQSTANVAYADMTRHVSELDREIAQLERELGMEGETSDNFTTDDKT
jgi:hypothetical protein